MVFKRRIRPVEDEEDFVDMKPIPPLEGDGKELIEEKGLKILTQKNY